LRRTAALNKDLMRAQRANAPDRIDRRANILLKQDLFRETAFRLAAAWNPAKMKNN
jgi:hypothetical protein